MKKQALLIAAVLCIISIKLTAQTDTLDEKTLGEVVISFNKFLERKKFAAQKIDVITSKQIASANAQNTGDLLINTGNVFVQKSQQGGSSPVLRGFEASRVLLVIDGIRMNNAVYRAGHLQNVITVDQNMLERVEVMYGPASTMYGSDALGGVIHLRTKGPKLSTTDKMLVTGSGFGRYSTANKEKSAHVDVSLGGKKFAWLQAYTFSDIGDMRMGSHYPKKYPTFGKRSQYITTINGIDSVVNNDNPQIQRWSGYQQWDITQKLLFKQSSKVTHLLNLQLSNSTDVPRYDRLQDLRNFGGSIGTTLRYAEWFYGPQERELAAYELSVDNSGGFVDQIKINVNYQNIEESRQQREYRRYDRFDSRREKINVIGFFVDTRKSWGNNELTIGLDGQFNDVKSRADRTNLTTGAVSKLDSRYPDGKNKMNYVGLYGQHLVKFHNNKLVLSAGIRLQYVSLKSNVVDNSFFNLPVTEFEQSNFAVTGNLSLVYLPNEDFRVSAGLSSGFRSPNIDDLVKVFDFSIARRVIVPNSDIGPEYTYNLDVSVSQTIAKKVTFEVTAFYTLFRNAIVSAPFTLNGQDSIVYNGVNSAVYANQNSNGGRTYGFNSNIRVVLPAHLSFYSTITYTYGRIKKFDGTRLPQDHIPPVFGKSSLGYSHGKLYVEAYAFYNGWKKLRNYNPDGEDNQQYATAQGMPSWFTFNGKAQYDVNRVLQLQVAMENIFDRNYRYFASGFSAPGRNLILAVRANF